MITVVICVLLVLLIVFLMAITANHTLYCWVFVSKDVSFYYKLNSISLSNYHLDKTYDDFHYIKCDLYPNFNIILKTKDKTVIIDNPKENELIMGDWYKKGSKKLYKKLIVLVEK